MTPKQKQKPIKSLAFRREREPIWFELEDLIQRIERGGVRSLPPEDLSRLPLLYRATLSSLGIARSISLDRNVVDYLESLCSRAYLCVYAARRSPWRVMLDFFQWEFPEAVRALRWHVLFSTFVFFLGGLVAYQLFQVDTEYFYGFVSDWYAQGRGPDTPTEDLRSILFSGRTQTGGDLAGFSSWLISHNSKIGMLCFALGIAGGIPVLYLLFENGLVLGGFLALYDSRGLGFEFLSWVLPHGITEILAVILSGAAGFCIGEAVVFPGKHDRLANIVIRGRTAGKVIIGAVVLFFLAALIEGFFRQTVMMVEARYLMATATALFWVVYFGGVGRDRQPTLLEMHDE